MSHRVFTRVTSDVEALNELFTAGVVAGLGDLFALLAMAVMMLVTDWRLALASFGTVPFVWLVSRVFQKKVRVAYREIRGKLARINAFAQERITGVRVVQLFSREPSESARFDALNRDHLDVNLKSITYYAAYFPAIEILTTMRNELELARVYRSCAAFRDQIGAAGAAAELRRTADEIFARLRGAAENY